MLGAVAVDLVGLWLAGVFELSVYLDMVGTANAAVALGPWHGVAVAVASNGLGFVTGDPHTLPFMPVNVVGALVWGHGVRRLRVGSTLGQYGGSQVLAAISSSIVAATFRGGAGHASERAMLSLETMQLPFVLSVFTTNIVTSIVDTLLSGFVALLVLALLHARM